MIDLDLLPFARLELIDDPEPRAAALNMAMDEVLLGRLDAEPILRIYRWEQRAVSIGYFEACKVAAKQWPGRDLVRRWTGGGIVPHGDDVTFSLLVPRSLVLATSPAADSYRLIHSAVASALAEAGCPRASLRSAASSADPGASRACFENPVRYDLLFSGRKVAGGAQRRTRRGLLHQGSIQYAAEGDTLLEPGILHALSGFLPQAFGVFVEARAFRAPELEAAHALAVEKYGSEAWLHRL